MPLLDALRKTDKRGLFNNFNPFAIYGSGFPPLDYLNAMKYTWYEDGQKKETYLKGLVGGRFMTIVGYSGTGKTTLADQIGWSICNSYPDDDEEAKQKFKQNALMIHIDVEKTALKSRIFEITGADELTDGHRIIINSDNTYIEDVMTMIDSICKEKESGGDEYKYNIDGKIFGVNGPIKMYVPTVFVIDSLKVFTSSSINESELEGGMSTQHEVKDITQFYSKCISRMTKYNITIICTNHIQTKIKINPYEADKPQLMLLKDGEYLPRGQAQIYLSTYLFRLNSSMSKANTYTVDEYGFDGYRTVLQVTKTKTNFIGGKMTLAFNKAIGYDPVMTLYEFANDNGLIMGRNPYLYIAGMDAYKFARKDFRKKFLEDSSFANLMLQTLKPYLENLIATVSSSDVAIDGNKLFTIDTDGNVVPTGVVETGSGEDAKLKLKA